LPEIAPTQEWGGRDSSGSEGGFGSSDRSDT
jgi:hypothetical protein